MAASRRSSGLALGRSRTGQPVPLEAVPPPAGPLSPGCLGLLPFAHLISEAPTAMSGFSRGTSHEEARLLRWLGP